MLLVKPYPHGAQLPVIEHRGHIFRVCIQIHGLNETKYLSLHPHIAVLRRCPQGSVHANIHITVSTEKVIIFIIPRRTEHSQIRSCHIRSILRGYADFHGAVLMRTNISPFHSAFPGQIRCISVCQPPVGTAESRGVIRFQSLTQIGIGTAWQVYSQTAWIHGIAFSPLFCHKPPHPILQCLKGIFIRIYPLAGIQEFQHIHQLRRAARLPAAKCQHFHSVPSQFSAQLFPQFLRYPVHILMEYLMKCRILLHIQKAHCNRRSARGIAGTICLHHGPAHRLSPFHIRRQAVSQSRHPSVIISMLRFQLRRCNDIIGISIQTAGSLHTSHKTGVKRHKVKGTVCHN